MSYKVSSFLAKTWLESVIARADSYAASALVITADTSSRPGHLGSVRAYLLVGSNEFYLTLPTGFDIEQLVDHILTSIAGDGHERIGSKSGLYVCSISGTRRKLKASYRLNSGGLEIYVHFPLFH